MAVQCHSDVWGIALPMAGQAFRVAESFPCVPGVDDRTVWLQPDRARGWCVEYDGAARAITRELELTVSGTVEAASRLGLVVRSDEGELWSCGYDGERRELLPAPGHVLASHESHVAIAERSSTSVGLVLLDVDSGEPVHVALPAGATLEPVSAASFSPDGKTLVLVVDVTVPDRERERALLQFGEVSSELHASGVGGLEYVRALDERVPGWRDMTTPIPNRGQLAVVRVSDAELTMIGGEFSGYVPDLVWSTDARSVVFHAYDEKGLGLWRTDDTTVAYVDVRGRAPSPMVDVTDSSVFGDLRVDHLAARMRPAWRGPIPERERTRLLTLATERVGAAMVDTAIPSTALAQSRPAIRIRSCTPGTRVPLGASRLGGRPDLPPGHTWPVHGGTPMAFLAQLRLAELSAALPSRELPSVGVLTIFAAIEPDGGFPVDDDGVHGQVIDDAGLARRSWPTALPPELRYSPAVAIVEPTLSVPDRPALEKLAPKQAVDRFLERTTGTGPDHQLLGHATTIQGTPPPPGYELLMQLDGDSILGASFGDGGRLYVWHATAEAITGMLDCRVDMDCY